MTKNSLPRFRIEYLIALIRWEAPPIRAPCKLTTSHYQWAGNKIRLKSRFLIKLSKYRRWIALHKYCTLILITKQRV